VAGAAIGAVIGGAVEAYQQVSSNQPIDIGRIAGHAAVGAAAGAITAVAGPAAGLGTVMALGASAGGVAYMGSNLVDSGGKTAGTPQGLAVSMAAGALTAGVVHNGAQLVQRALPGAQTAVRRAMCVCGTSCFAAGTTVATLRGPVPIEQVEPGDLVQARDDQTGQMGWQPVVQKFVNAGKTVFELELVGDDDAGHTLEVTPEHPFWVEGRGWVEAGELAQGDLVGNPAGGRLRVAAKGAPRTQGLVYNLEVGGFHSYFVGAGEVWVHNAGPCPSGGGAKGGGPVRVRHFSNSKGVKGIESEGVITASDQNKVFTVRAQGKPGSPRDVEEALGIKRGRGNNYVEFDANADEIQTIKNARTGATETVFDGNVDLAGRNATFHKNR
jgi:hypothetical protein